jgi:hypothetical protein
MIAVAVHMVVHHVVATTKALAKIFARIARQVRVAEVVVAVRIRRTAGVDVMPCGFDAIVEAAVPCVRPGTLRLDGLPGSWRGRAFLSMNGEGNATREGKT